MLELVSIFGFKPDNQYSDDILAYIGEAYVLREKSFGKFDNAFVQDYSKTQFFAPQSQETLSTNNKKAYMSIGRKLIKFCNKEKGVKIFLETSLLKQMNSEEFAIFLYQAIKRSIENIGRNYPNIEEIQVLRKQAKESDESNPVTAILTIVDILNSIDKRFPHKKVPTVTLDDLSKTKNIEVDHNLAAKEIGLDVINHLSGELAVCKITTDKAFEMANAYQEKKSAQEVTELTLTYIQKFYSQPIENLVNQINNSLFSLFMQNIEPEFFTLRDISSSNDDFLGPALSRLDIIKEWVDCLKISSASDKSKEILQLKTQQFINIFLKLLNFTRSYIVSELTPFQKDIQILLETLPSSFSEGNSVRKELQVLLELIKDQMEYCSMFGKTYIDCHICQIILNEEKFFNTNAKMISLSSKLQNNTDILLEEIFQDKAEIDFLLEESEMNEYWKLQEKIDNILNTLNGVAKQLPLRTLTQRGLPDETFYEIELQKLASLGDLREYTINSNPFFHSFIFAKNFTDIRELVEGLIADLGDLRNSLAADHMKLLMSEVSAREPYSPNNSTL